MNPPFSFDKSSAPAPGAASRPLGKAASTNGAPRSAAPSSAPRTGLISLAPRPPVAPAPQVVPAGDVPSPRWRQLANAAGFALATDYADLTGGVDVRSSADVGGRSDRRAATRGGAERQPAALQLRLTLSGGGAPGEEILDLLTGDVSAGGVFVHCEEPPPVGLRARVTVCRPNGGAAFSAVGEVVWRRPPGDRAGRAPGFGLRFDRLTLRDGDAIAGLVGLLQRQRAAQTEVTPELLLYGLSDMTADVVGILQTELPPELRVFLHGFHAVADRDDFLWRWAYQGIVITTLSTVPEALWAAARECKLLSLVFLVLLDDALDRAVQKGGEREAIFQELCHLALGLRIGAGGLAAAEGDPPVIAFGKRVLSAILLRAEALPRAGEFLPLWLCELSQLVLDARHQRLYRGQTAQAGEGEALVRGAGHSGLPLLLCAALDLCASPGFDRRELGLLREVLGVAQRMHGLALVLAGWERAVQGGDLGGPVVAYALASGLVSTAELGALRGPELAARLKAARVESHFLTEWLRARQQTRELAGRLRSVDIQRLLQAHQRLLWMQLDQRGVAL